MRRLQYRGEELLADALQLTLREGRAQRHVSHDRQRVAEPRNRHVEVDERSVGRARRGEVRPEVIDRIGDLQRVATGGSFVQHFRREIGESEFFRRVGACPGPDRQRDVRDRHVVQFYNPDLQTVGEGLLLDGRELQRRGRSRFWRG